MDLAVRRNVALNSLNLPAFYKAGNDYAAQIFSSLYGPFVHVAAVTSEYRFLTGGLTRRFGLPLQIGFALCATVEAFQIYGKDNLASELKSRVDQDIYIGLIAACLKKEWALSRKLLGIFWRYASIRSAPKRGWWALAQFYENGDLGDSAFLSALTRYTRLILDVRRQR